MGDWYRPDVVRFPDMWTNDWNDGVFGYIYTVGIGGRTDAWVWQIKTKDGEILDQRHIRTDENPDAEDLAFEEADRAHDEYMSRPWSEEESREHGYITPGNDPTMPGGGPPVYHGPEERYGGRRDVHVRRSRRIVR